MRVIIAGGRNFTDYDLVKLKVSNILNGATGVEIVSGACDTGTVTYTRPDGTEVCGADGLGERYANENGFKVVPFPAHWELFGKSAGFVRNRQMAEYATHCICFWDGFSKGTKNMIELATEYDLKRRVINY